MNILWITNIPLPPIAEEMKWRVIPLGGWMYSSLKNLVKEQELELSVATVYEGDELIEKKLSDGIRYFLVPLKGNNIKQYNSHLEEMWRIVKSRCSPDVIHIHGTEFPHGLAYITGCGADGVVVSIQGLVSVIERYSSLRNDCKKRIYTLRDIIKGESSETVRKDFEKAGQYEKTLISSVRNVIGRTEWDRNHIWAINPEAKYYFCGENMRDSFYERKWSYEHCEPHTIFISQASYAIKGFHKVLQALPLIIKEFPDTKVYVGGTNVVTKPFWKITEYGKYISNLIKKNSLEENVIFMGMMSEEEMCERYLKSNVFVCCSSIENSSNSIGEAQLLRMPFLASFVGGSPELVEYNSNILYRYDEYEMLAKKIVDIFKLADRVERPSFDLTRYDREGNTKQLKYIYKEIASV